MPNLKTLSSTTPVSPAVHAEQLPDGTTTELAEFSRGIYIGGTGDLVVLMGGMSTLTTFPNVPAGTLLPIGIHTINATTTATGVVAIY